MHCPECGTEVSEDSSFCMNCGEELSKVKNDAKTQSTNNNGEVSQPSSDTNNENGSSQMGTISRRGIIASLSLAGIGTAVGGGYYFLRQPETIIRPNYNKSKNGISSQKFKLNRPAHINIRDARGARLIYSSSKNSIFHAEAVYHDIVPDDAEPGRFPFVKSGVLPAGEYTLISNYYSPRLEVYPAFLPGYDGKNSVNLSVILDHLSNTPLGFTQIPSRDDTKSSGYNIKKRVVGAEVGPKVGWFAQDVNRWIEIEEMVRYMAQNSNSAIENRYKQIEKKNELWRSGLLTCASINSSIENLYSDLISNISSEVSNLNRIPTKLFSKSINLLSGGDGVDAGMYATIPQYETEKRVTLPVGIYIDIDEDVPFISEDTVIYTPTVPISAVKTRDNGAPSLDQKGRSSNVKISSMWEPAVSDIQSELIDKFSNSL